MSDQINPSESRKIAIVTGGSRGIGRNTVVGLAKRGVHSIFTFNSPSRRCGSSRRGGKMQLAPSGALQLDAGNIASFDAFIKDVGMRCLTSGNPFRFPGEQRRQQSPQHAVREGHRGRV